jgi:hypothetical protein
MDDEIKQIFNQEIEEGLIYHNNIKNRKQKLELNGPKFAIK